MHRARSETSPAKVAASAPSIGSLIEDLLRSLVEMRGEPRNGPDLTGTRPGVWEDDEYHYLETMVNQDDVSFCDISISQGKVFIRIAREDECEDTPDCLPILSCIIPIDMSTKV